MAGGAYGDDVEAVAVERNFVVAAHYFDCFEQSAAAGIYPSLCVVVAFYDDGAVSGKNFCGFAGDGLGKGETGILDVLVFHINGKLVRTFEFLGEHVAETVGDLDVDGSRGA